MRKIFKYIVPLEDRFHLKLPVGFEILHFGKTIHNELCIWVLINPEAKEETAYFEMYGTGMEIKGIDQLKFIGTAICGVFVWHLFRVVGGK